MGVRKYGFAGGSAPRRQRLSRSVTAPCVRPQVDPGPLLSTSAVSLLYTIVVWTEPIPKPSTSPAHAIPRAGADPIGISVYSLTKDPTHISHRLICADVRMQSLCPPIPRLWVSLAGRNYPPVSCTRVGNPGMPSARTHAVTNNETKLKSAYQNQNSTCSRSSRNRTNYCKGKGSRWGLHVAVHTYTT